MPNPKRKTSKTRRDKRRTHYKAIPKQFAIDATATMWTMLGLLSTARDGVSANRPQQSAARSAVRGRVIRLMRLRNPSGANSWRETIDRRIARRHTKTGLCVAVRFAHNSAVLDVHSIAPTFRHLVHRLSDPEQFGIAVSGVNLTVDFLAPQKMPTRVEQFQAPEWTLDFHEAHVKARVYGPLPPGWVSLGLMASPPLPRGMARPPDQARSYAIHPAKPSTAASHPASRAWR